MKKIFSIIAIAGVLSTQGALAGNLSDPVVEEPVIVAETAASSGDVLIPLLFLLFAAGIHIK